MKTKTTGFRQLKNKTWEINTTVKVDNEYKHFQKKGYPTLSAAKADFERAKEEFIKKHTKHHEMIYFEDLIEEYKKMRKSTVSEGTLVCDNSVYNVYMYPYFKGKKIKDVFEKEIIRNWYHDIVDNPKYSANKKSKVITVMKSILKFAYMHEFIDPKIYQSCDVCLYQVKVSKKAQTERVVWTLEEERAFLEATKENYADYLMFNVFLASATRLGEFLGLQVNCFDYANRKITIKQQVNPKKGQSATLTARLKSEQSYRTIILTKEIADMLQEYIETFALKENHYLFFSRSGKYIPLSRTTFRRKLEVYCSKANVREINPHAARHSMACKLAKVCKTGAEIEAAARRLGHTPSVFLNTYAAHVDDELENELLSRMVE